MEKTTSSWDFAEAAILYSPVFMTTDPSGLLRCRHDPYLQRSAAICHNGSGKTLGDLGLRMTLRRLCAC